MEQGRRPNPQTEGGAVWHLELGDHRSLPPGPPGTPVQGEVAQRHRPYHCEKRMDSRRRCIYPNDASKYWKQMEPNLQDGASAWKDCQPNQKPVLSKPER